MFQETQKILLFFEEENKAVSVFDLSKVFSDLDAETIDGSITLLQVVGFIEPTGYLQWRVTDDCRILGKRFRENSNQNDRAVIQNLEQQIDFDQEHFPTRQYINDKRTIISAVLFATLLILIY